jgi:type IV secretory pathway TrbL component
VPTKQEIFDALKKELEERPEAKDERAFMGDVKKAQQERVANEKKRTKFVADTGSPEVYVSLNRSKDFVLDHIENVSVAWSLLAWAWRQLENKEVLDELLAKGPK